MPPPDWNQLFTHDQWAQVLHELLAAAQRALAQPEAARPAAVQAAIEALRDYVRHEPGFIDDLLAIANSAIIDAALEDLGDALAQLGDLQRQLQLLLHGQLLADRFAPSGAVPRQRVVQALAALTALRAQHRQQPLAHPTLAPAALDRRLGQALGLLAALLPPAPGAGPPSRRRAARK